MTRVLRKIERGFSLIELMIALAISAGVVLIAAQSIVQVKTSEETGKAIASRDQDSLTGLSQSTSIQNIKRMIEKVNSPAFQCCRNQQGSNCNSVAPEFNCSQLNDQIYVLQQTFRGYDNLTKTPILDSKISLTPVCSGSSCEYHKIKIETGLAPLSDKTVHSSTSEVRVPNFWVTDKAQLLSNVNFACSNSFSTGQPGQILYGVDYTKAPGLAICRSATSTQGSLNCSDTLAANHAPLISFGGYDSASTTCITPSTIAINCSDNGAGGTKGFALNSHYLTRSGEKSDGSGQISVACGPRSEINKDIRSPAAYTPPDTQGPRPTLSTTFSPIFNLSCGGGRSLDICLGTSLKAYLNKNDCAVDSVQCPTAGHYSQKGNVTFKCRCISFSQLDPNSPDSVPFPAQWCASDRVYTGQKIDIGPSYNDKEWFMDSGKDTRSSCN